MLVLITILASTFTAGIKVQVSYASYGERSSDVTDYNGKLTTKHTSEEEFNVESKDDIDEQKFAESKDKWNFNNTNDWIKFAYVDGNKTRLIVGIKDTGDLNILEEIAEKHEAIIVSKISFKDKIKAIVVELPIISVSKFVEDARALGLTSYIEPDMKVQVEFEPNDPYWGLQWGPRKIEANWAWNVTLGSSSVLVAVIDTGIDYEHPDLAANYVPLGYDWVNYDSDPLDDYGHGTHCAGIIAAVINNSLGIAGLAQVKIMAEKCLDSWGYGYWDWVASGIIHAVDAGADIISMSFGGYADSQLLHDAIRYAYDAGVLLVAAAGNDNTNMKHYPACYDEVIAVAATDEYDNKAYFSNWGGWIELAAPGVNIYSTMPTYYVTLNDFGYSMNYDYLSGTSMACPHVSGVAALLWSLYPNKTRDWIRLWLQYTADDLGSPGFDVYYGYGRINVRKAVEELPPAHELVAYQWTTPLYVEPGTTGIINATVLNFGETNETDITVQLIANGTIVDSVTIGSLTAGEEISVSLSWTPVIEGLYNLTLYVVPVLGETILENNMLQKYIYVGFPVKAVVLHSAGNVFSEIITNWQVLNNEWYLFGDTMVCIDYTTLNKEGITYEDIAATEADVLIISCAADPYLGWEFTDSEIDAITRYVHEGHGLIVTAGTLYYMVPNNNKLASLLGLNENIRWYATWSDLLHLINTTHPLFTKVPNPLVFPQVGTALPDDGIWDMNELAGGKYIALGHYQESAIVAYRGLVYISPWLEIIPPYYRHHLQLLYNAITWSRYQKPEHELVTSLEAPSLLKPGESSLLNATVCNMGVNNETDVDLFLLINGTVVNSTRIPELLTGECYTISYLWTPTVEGLYNVTASALPVLDEEFILNNVDTKMVLVREIVVENVLVYTDDYALPPSERYPIVALENLGINYTHYSDDPYGFVRALTTQRWDLVIVSHNNYYAFGNNWDELEEYVLNGGLLILSTFDIDGSHSEPTTLWSTLGVEWSSDMYYPEPVYRWIPTHPIFTTPNMVGDLTSYVEGYIDDGDHVRATTGIPIAGFTSSPTTGHAAIVVGNGGRTVLMSFLVSEFRYDEDGDGKLDAVELWENAIAFLAMPVEHELTVSLDAPAYLELGNSIVLNATVVNRGLNNETDVELYLLIDGTPVNSTVIPELLVGECYTISYLWTPKTGSYNVTVYAPPVLEEEYTTNNVVSKVVAVFFYKRFCLPHKWIGGGYPMGWHADDGCWEYTLPFDFPFYSVNYSTIYISSNGLITFLEPDYSYINSISELAHKLAIAPAWDDWTTYSPYDIYVWENSTHVGIRWRVAHLSTGAEANFEVILKIDGTIYFNYGYNDGPISATIGISNGVNHILAQEQERIDYIDTIVFTPFYRDVAVYNATVYPNRVFSGEPVNINVTVLNEGEKPENFNVSVYITQTGTALSIPALSEPIEHHPADAMWIEPSSIDLTGYTTGQKFNVTVWLNVTEPCYSWQFKIYFNNTYLNAIRAGYTAGSTSEFFEGLTTLPLPPRIDNDVGYVLYAESLLGEGQRDPGYGSLAWIEFNVTDASILEQLVSGTSILEFDSNWSYYMTPDLEYRYPSLYGCVYGVSPPSPPPAPPPSPPTQLIGREEVYLLPKTNVTLTFTWNTTEVAVGNYTIVASVEPAKHEANLTNNMLVAGIVEIMSQHDVAVTDIKTSRTWIYQTNPLDFNVTVENKGDFIENITLTLYYNISSEGIISQATITNLEPGENITITLTWDTAEIPPCHNYTIVATVTIKAPDNNPADNIYVNGAIRVKLFGDVNDDQVIDISDLSITAQAYGSYPGHPRWLLAADINMNLSVDICDLALIAKNYGKAC